ncbi:hypothetical protein BG000_009091 [Podila horticola]|nr:hypothetical protein BG000_009091 [Podila horticola]
MATNANSTLSTEESSHQIQEDYPHEDLPHFTWRAVAVGLVIGTLLCFTNMYFGLQTGWISMMSLQSSLLGFAVFKAGKRFLKVPFGPAENIVLQSVAVATGTMPLAAGFVGIIPALQMMTTEENPSGPVFLSTGNMILWSLAIAFFGVFIAVPLRKQVIVKEKLPFPSGTATAQMIGVLHNVPLVTRGRVVKVSSVNTVSSSTSGIRKRHVGRDDDAEIVADEKTQDNIHKIDHDSDPEAPVEIKGENGERFTLDRNFVSDDNWTTNMTALGIAFTLSGLYTILSYFFPVVAAIPIFDWLTGMTVTVGGTWQWFLTPSLSYVGQGIIMGFPTTASMLLGCVVGWGILSPIVTKKGWVTGPVSSSSTGARGWILWVSLGVMIAEAVVSLLGVIVLSLIAHYRLRVREQRQKDRRAALEASAAQTGASVEAFSELELEEEEEDDAPIDQLVPLRLWVIGLILSSALCLLLIWVVFKDQHMPVYATLLAVFLGCILSVLGVRALGSTDLNPVSGIGKVSQFIFAGVVPGGIVANLIAGGIAEAGAQQAGDLMQDLKTGHLLGASPKAQFWAQLIGSFFSVFISTGVFKLYSSAYQLPGPEFAVPTAKVWLDLAKLVNGHSLPLHTGPFIWGFAGFFAGLTLLTVIYSDVAFLKSRDGVARGRPRTFSIVNLILKTAKIHSASGVGCYVGMCTVN